MDPNAHKSLKACTDAWHRADLFKISTAYTQAGQTFNVAFTVPGQANQWYPFTTAPLSPGAEAALAGYVSLPARLQGETVLLQALADSCSGDALMPTYCRVAESNEANNLSAPIAITLTTPNNSPQVIIISPKGSEEFLADQFDRLSQRQYAQVTLLGNATDPEDGLLSGNSLVWTTNRTDLQSTVLGNGPSVTTRLFAGGCGMTVHTLTLTATDSEGQASAVTQDVPILVLCVGTCVAIRNEVDGWLHHPTTGDREHRCGIGQNRLLCILHSIALVTDRTVVMAILRHLGMPTSSPPSSLARMAAQGELFDDGWNVAPSRTPSCASSRKQIPGPPGEVWVEFDPTSETDQWDA